MEGAECRLQGVGSRVDVYICKYIYVYIYVYIYICNNRLIHAYK